MCLTVYQIDRCSWVGNGAERHPKRMNMQDKLSGIRKPDGENNIVYGDFDFGASLINEKLEEIEGVC